MHRIIVVMSADHSAHPSDLVRSYGVSTVIR
jgi:hypothetical protein